MKNAVINENLFICVAYRHGFNFLNDKFVLEYVLLIYQVLSLFTCSVLVALRDSYIALYTLNLTP